MKVLVSIIFISLILCSCNANDPSSSEPAFYKLTISVSGQGSYEVIPDKAEYESGEKVTITATAKSGWGFRKWQGNINSEDNPLILTMDRDKSIQAVFSVTFEPVITGKWAGIEYLVTFDIVQPSDFDSTVTGIMLLETIYGDTLEYSVIGYNRGTLVILDCNRGGYFPIQYKGWWANDTRINGGMTEDGIYYKCDIVKIVDSSVPKGGALFPISQISE
jgi:hypothetical protein